MSTAFVEGFVCGIPRMIFDRGLSWCIPRNRGEPATRRSPSLSGSTTDKRPTWTWAAWEGQIESPVDYAETFPLVQWQYYSRPEDDWSIVIEEEIRTERSGNCQEPSLEVPNILGLADHQRFNLLFARPGRAHFRLTTRGCGFIPWNNYWGTAVVGSDGIRVGKIKALK